MGVKDHMPKKATLNIAASVLLLLTLISVPAMVGYIHDFLSSLTHQTVIRYVEDKHIVYIELRWYNSTAGSWQTDVQSWVYDNATHKIIIPSIEQSAPSESTSDTTLRLNVLLNSSYFTGRWLWDACVEHVIIALSCSANTTIHYTIVGAYDDAGVYHAKEWYPNASGADYTIDLKLSYALRAWFSQFTGQLASGAGLAIGLRFSEPASLAGEYMELTIYFTRTEKAWVAGISDAVLAGIGMLMIIAAIFATPYVSLKDLARLAKGRRR